MALTDNLVSYWKLDESSGNAADSVGSNTLTNNSSIAYGTGIINNGADIENSLGEGQFFSIADGSQSGLDITGDISFSFWIKFETLPLASLATPIAKWASTGDQRQYFLTIVDIGVADYRIQCDYRSDGATTRTVFRSDTLAWSTGVWYHIVAAADVSAQNWEIYRNDTNTNATADTTGATSIFNGTGDFALGRQGSDNTGYMDAVLDEVGIWSRELTSAEVTELYNGGAGLQYPFGGGGGATIHPLLMGV